jgi:myo-inositol-1(or 4)-monophosphatase
MDNPLTFTTGLAYQVGELLLGYFKKNNIISNWKSDRTLVTEADIAADRFITEAILKNFPADYVLSEETNPISPDKTSPSIWIVDPLDGTTNFSLGIHHWGVLITLVKNGQPVMTVNYFPVINELYTAQIGEGAFLNEKRIHVESPENDKKLSFFSCCSRTFRHYQVNIPYKIRIFGCAAYSMCSVARGISKISFEARAKVWDIAGAWLLVKEGGGAIDVLEGGLPFPLNPGEDYNLRSFPVISAPDRELIQKARAQIIPK